ncbi:MAG: UDP-N-acetylmuramoyl-L-alanine--D-glutamate ligase [Bauldia sp.]|nr:UDP-N-acetylmuramoyl-L-alanine--D-glutamate ligase [Bauldia sp.]
MIPATSFSGRKVALFGLGGSGRATAASLVAGGADVSAWDDNAEATAGAAEAGIPVVNLHDVDWKDFAALVLAPGVPLTHPVPHWTVTKAASAGIEVIGDIEIFSRERKRSVPTSPFVAITGTNGKSTTTALIGHLLKSTGRDTQVGGNIGTPILKLDPPRTGRYHVIEVSSFQIDLAPGINPSLGVLLNVTPDHLDRHGTMERYAGIKERLVAAAKTAVIAVDDKITQAIADRLEQAGRRIVRVSTRLPLASGFYAEGSVIYEAENGAATEVVRLDGVSSLRGLHNAQNAAVAVAVARKLGLPVEEIRQGVASFRGLRHRMEEVGRRGRVIFINDSKATNADAAAKALASFDRIYWIAGGRAKEGGIDSLKGFFPKIAKAYLIGEAAEGFAATLQPTVEVEMSGTLAAAVEAAARDSLLDNADEVAVLLSPACASYDQFQNFERRGDAFRSAALSLDGVRNREEAA